MGCGCSNSAQASDPLYNNLLLPPDYEEFPEQEVGEGIKRTVAWSTSASSAELAARREMFWKTRQGGLRQAWMVLKQAAEADAATAVILLEYVSLVPDYGSMTACFDMRGNRYEVPAFVLNDPVRPKAKTTNLRKQPSEKEIRVKVRSIGCATDKEVTINNTQSIAALKTLAEIENARVFFSGKELKHEAKLWEYGISDGMVVQVFLKQEGF